MCPPYLPKRDQTALLRYMETYGAGTLCGSRPVYVSDTASKEATIRKFTLGLVGAAAVAAGLLLMRQQKQTQPKEALAEAESASGAITSGTTTLERMRELGL